MSSETISERSLRELIPFLEFRGWHLTPYTDFDSQCHKGDYRVTNDAGISFNLECKAEAKFTGNIFIEMVSNAETGRDGWLANLRDADVVIYHFLQGPVYVIQMRDLKRMDLSQYPTRVQHKYQQANETHGCIVPIQDLKRYKVITQEFSLPCD
jgi:hypothetical protein